MICIPNISIINIRPLEPGGGAFTIRCIGGNARWARVLGTLLLQADTIMDVVAEPALEYLESKQSRFDLEISCPSQGQDGGLDVTPFFGCEALELSGRELSMRPHGQRCRRYQMAIRAEQGAPPNVGLPTPPEKSIGSGGPPSVS